MVDSKFFSPQKLGPLTLRNGSIRAAAFEGMSWNHNVSPPLTDYHVELARGGIGMTTLAYASVNKGGLSFPHQLWMRKDIIPELKGFTENIHKEGAAVSVQLGHCGNMANRSVTGERPVAPSSRINWYGPTFPREMTHRDILQLRNDFVAAALMAAESGFDAIEIHAGHGYLISQFLSPFTNKRKDEYGGSFTNRARLMNEILKAVRDALPARMAMLVKMNSYDGFPGGITKDEGVQIAKEIENSGADAVVVSGGFVSRAPMYVMRGAMPVEIMTHFMKSGIKKFFVALVGKQLIASEHFEEGFFLNEAKRIQDSLKIPVVLVGGVNSMATIQKATDEGFRFIAFARALIENPHFIKDLENGVIEKSVCTVCNYCVAKIYSSTMECQLHQEKTSEILRRKIASLPHE